MRSFVLQSIVHQSNIFRNKWKKERKRKELLRFGSGTLAVNPKTTFNCYILLLCKYATSEMIIFFKKTQMFREGGRVSCEHCHQMWAQIYRLPRPFPLIRYEEKWKYIKIYENKIWVTYLMPFHCYQLFTLFNAIDHHMAVCYQASQTTVFREWLLAGIILYVSFVKRRVIKLEKDTKLCKKCEAFLHWLRLYQC